MAKLISLKQQEGHDARATAYIKAYMLFPAGILGLTAVRSLALTRVGRFLAA